MEKILSWRRIIITGVFFLFFMLYLMPSYQAELNEIVGSEVEPLDLRFSYTKDDVLLHFEILKLEGREKIEFISGVVDMIYPIVYGLFFFLLLTRLTSHFSNNTLKMIRFFPLMGMLFDYIENFNVLSMLNAYPAISEQQVFIGSSATSLKWSFLSVAIILTLVLAGIRVFKKQ